MRLADLYDDPEDKIQILAPHERIPKVAFKLASTFVTCFTGSFDPRKTLNVSAITASFPEGTSESSDIWKCVLAGVKAAQHVQLGKDYRITLPILSSVAPVYPIIFRRAWSMGFSAATWAMAHHRDGGGVSPAWRKVIAYRHPENWICPLVVTDLTLQIVFHLDENAGRKELRKLVRIVFPTAGKRKRMVETVAAFLNLWSKKVNLQRVVGVYSPQVLSAMAFIRASANSGAEGQIVDNIISQTERVLTNGRLRNSPAITDPRWDRFCPELLALIFEDQR